MSVVSWKGTGTVGQPTSGSFETSSNWTGGSIPGANDATNLASGNYSVTISSDESVKSLFVDKGVNLSISDHDLTLSSSLSNSGSVNIGSDASIVIADAFYNDGTVYGPENGSSQVSGGSFFNDGIVQSSDGSGAGYLSFTSADQFYNFEGSQLIAGVGEIDVASQFTNYGTVSAVDGGSVDFFTRTYDRNHNVTYTSGGVTNISDTGVLTGGKWIVSGSSGIKFYSNSVEEIAAGTNVQLSGAKSSFGTLQQGQVFATSIESSLVTVDAGASLQVLGNRDYTTGNTISLGGTLQLGGGTLSGNLDAQSGSLVSGFGTISGAVTGEQGSPSVGSIRVDADQTLSFTGNTNSFAGAFGGAGTIALAAGYTNLLAGTTLGVQSLGLSGANVTLYTNLSFKGSLAMSAGQVFFANKALTLTGNETLSGGTFGSNGTLNLRGATTIAGNTFTVQNDVRATNTKFVDATGDMTLSDAATFTNAATGTYTLGGDGADILAGSDATGSFKNYGTLQKAAGSGASTIGVKLYNRGTIDTAANLTLSGGVTGTGTLSISGTGTLEVAGAVAKTQALTFAAGGDGTLLIDHGQSFAGTVAGFVSGDTIDFGGVTSNGTNAYYHANAGNTGGSLIVKNGSERAVVTLDGQFIASGFHAASDSAGTGTTVTYTPPAQAAHLAVAHA